ncbi:MAG: 1-deoxy-D-xylulose-5-phosphate reductoisomerase [Kiritimatiellia bacterium]
MKNIVILGSTGSIGRNALKIVESLPGRFNVVGAAAASSADLLLEQAAEFQIGTIALLDPEAASRARDQAPAGVKVLEGVEGLCELASRPDVDLVVCAIVGMAALKPVLAAIDAGHDVAIATKEVLVSAGEVVCRRCEEMGINLLPIDSEHSALFQAIQDSGRMPWCVRNRPGAAPGRPVEGNVRRLILTASGGPFAGRPELDFSTVTVEQALDHPRWKMGPKVTIDSATMMNKGLEILEARWLFDIPVDRIAVLVHPESIVHSLVEFTDGAQLAQLGVPDMRLPIQYAMTWPERVGNDTLPRLDLSQAGTLHFSEPDPARFPCLGLVRRAAAAGGVAPAAMNAANEVAVAAFLEGRMRLPGIWETVAAVLDECAPVAGALTLDAILEADAWARRRAEEVIA